MPWDSPPMLTRSLWNTKSSQLRVFVNSILIAIPKKRNLRTLWSSMAWWPSDRRLSSWRLFYFEINLTHKWLIVGQTRVSAIEIQRRLEREGHQVACLTGEFEGFQRDMIIDAFRDGKAKVLITTNVLARGIDVQTVSLVINYVSHQASAPNLNIGTQWD